MMLKCAGHIISCIENAWTAKRIVLGAFGRGEPGFSQCVSAPR
ncbi:MAG: hypothetical protein ACI835_001482 [Planctomycetota bacterium]|jgi:hypothetical protein